MCRLELLPLCTFIIGLSPLFPRASRRVVSCQQFTLRDRMAGPCSETNDRHLQVQNLEHAPCFFPRDEIPPLSSWVIFRKKQNWKSWQMRSGECRYARVGLFYSWMSTGSGPTKNNDGFHRAEASKQGVGAHPTHPIQRSNDHETLAARRVNSELRRNM